MTGRVHISALERPIKNAAQNAASSGSRVHWASGVQNLETPRLFTQHENQAVKRYAIVE